MEGDKFFSHEYLILSILHFAHTCIIALPFVAIVKPKILLHMTQTTMIVRLQIEEVINSFPTNI
jgi:hypothetical protein